MDALIQLLTEYGYLGMLAAAFLAGSFFPFSSELVMVGLMAAGLDPLLLVVYGTVGNVLGSVFNYGVGYMGRIDWIEKYLHVRKEKLERTRQFLAGKGAWMGILAFLPILGSVVTIVLGLMRANMTITFISITIGKFLRYLLLVYGVGIFI